MRLLSRASPTSNPYFSPSTFLDQLALAVALYELAPSVQVLDDRFNRPLHYSGHVRKAGGSRMSAVVHGQHQGYLGDGQFSRRLWRGHGADARAAWMETESTFAPSEDHEWPPTFISRFDAEYEGWRHELKTILGRHR
jgi:hypothetical protein